MAHSGGLTRQQCCQSGIVAVFHQPAAALMRVALQSNPGGSHLTYGHKKPRPVDEVWLLWRTREDSNLRPLGS